MADDPAAAFLAAVRSLRRAAGADGEYAPHKPLLLLWALGRVQRGEPRVVPFAEAEGPLFGLLAEFGPINATSPLYPFWHMANDAGVWALDDPGSIPRTSRRPTIAAMREHARGGLPAETDALLREDSALLAAAAAELLGYLPASQTEEILSACGLSVTVALKRDPVFRKAVFLAYEQRCVICGWDIRLGGELVGLEAAHVWQWAKGGPDRIENGLLLCSLHHKAYDRGVVSLDEDRRVLVSQHAVGGDRLGDVLLRYAGQPMRLPQPGYEPPSALLLKRHREAMFRSPARLVA